MPPPPNKLSLNFTEKGGGGGGCRSIFGSQKLGANSCCYRNVEEEERHHEQKTGLLQQAGKETDVDRVKMIVTTLVTFMAIMRDTLPFSDNTPITLDGSFFSPYVLLMCVCVFVYRNWR